MEGVLFMLTAMFVLAQLLVFFACICKEFGWKYFFIGFLLLVIWIQSIAITFNEIKFTKPQEVNLLKVEKLQTVSKGALVLAQFITASDGKLINVSEKYGKVYPDDQIFVEEIYPIGWYGFFYFWTEHKTYSPKKD